MKTLYLYTLLGLFLYADVFISSYDYRANDHHHYSTTIEYPPSSDGRNSTTLSLTSPFYPLNDPSSSSASVARLMPDDDYENDGDTTSDLSYTRV